MLQFLSALAILFLVFVSKRKNRYLTIIKKNYLVIGFGISFLATLFSLIYSEVIGFVPCRLCWFQRIFMYPQILIFGLALWQKIRYQIVENKEVLKYSFLLTLVGLSISIYHNVLYYAKSGIDVLCDASGISCFKRIVSVFGGYISIPMLSLSAFFALMTMTIIVYLYKERD